MHVVNLVFGGIVGAVLWPFRCLSPWFGLTAVSLLTAVLMLEVYKLTSNQPAIRRAKDGIKAHLLEMRLYKDDLRTTFRAQAGVLKANGAYLAANLKPLAVMIAPLVLILAQLSLWYDRAPLKPGQEALVKVVFDRTSDPMTLDLGLEPPPGLEVTSPAVRIPDEHEAVWRVKAVAPGAGRFVVRIGRLAVGKTVAVGGPAVSRLSSLASRGSFANRVLHPGEPPLASSTPVRSVEVLYPPARLSAFGLAVHWLVAYLILSIAFGFALKGVFKVEI
jgi:hypothetical protein